MDKKSLIDAYLLRLRQRHEQRYQEWTKNPSPVALRIRAIKEQRQKERENHQ